MLANLKVNDKYGSIVIINDSAFVTFKKTHSSVKKPTDTPSKTLFADGKSIDKKPNKNITENAIDNVYLF